MSAAVAVLLVCSPFAREPVGAPNWQQSKDPVVRRVGSLLAGKPHRRGYVTVVPLYARIPSEAGHGLKNGPVWIGGSERAKEIREQGRIYLRVINSKSRPVFVPAGAVFARDAHEALVARDAIVAADFAALFPAWLNLQAVRAPPAGELDFAGVLPPQATGLMLHPKGNPNHVLAAWQRHFKVKRFIEATNRKSVATMALGLEKLCSKVPTELGGTAVGAVFLVAGRPVAAHVFQTNEMFAQALPDLLMGLSLEARSYQSSFGGPAGVVFARLQRAAEVADEQHRAVALLRGTLDKPASISESYGEGFEVMIVNEDDRAIGHAVLDHRRSLVHFGIYPMPRRWPGKVGQGGPGGPGTNPVPPMPPMDNGSEQSPGEIDRKARPTQAEQRWRDRRPGSNPGGRGGGGNNGRGGGNTGGGGGSRTGR